MNIYYIIFSICLVVGFYFSYQYGKKTTQFKWDEYFATLIFPFIGLAVLLIFVGGCIEEKSEFTINPDG